MSLPSSTGLVFQPWSAWLKDQTETSDVSKRESKKHLSALPVTFLPLEDYRHFGYCPQHDDFLLATCDRCSILIKPHALKAHIAFHHAESSASATSSLGSPVFAASPMICAMSPELCCTAEQPQPPANAGGSASLEPAAAPNLFERFSAGSGGPGAPPRVKLKLSRKAGGDSAGVLMVEQQLEPERPNSCDSPELGPPTLTAGAGGYAAAGTDRNNMVSTSEQRFVEGAGDGRLRLRISKSVLKNAGAFESLHIAPSSVRPSRPVELTKQTTPVGADSGLAKDPIGSAKPSSSGVASTEGVSLEQYWIPGTSQSDSFSDLDSAIFDCGQTDSLLGDICGGWGESGNCSLDDSLQAAHPQAHLDCQWDLDVLKPADGQTGEGGQQILGATEGKSKVGECGAKSPPINPLDFVSDRGPPNSAPPNRTILLNANNHPQPMAVNGYLGRKIGLGSGSRAASNGGSSTSGGGGGGCIIYHRKFDQIRTSLDAAMDGQHHTNALQTQKEAMHKYVRRRSDQRKAAATYGTTRSCYPHHANGILLSEIRNSNNNGCGIKEASRQSEMPQAQLQKAADVPRFTTLNLNQLASSMLKDGGGLHSGGVLSVGAEVERMTSAAAPKPPPLRSCRSVEGSGAYPGTWKPPPSTPGTLISYAPVDQDSLASFAKPMGMPKLSGGPPPPANSISIPSAPTSCVNLPLAAGGRLSATAAATVPAGYELKRSRHDGGSLRLPLREQETMNLRQPPVAYASGAPAGASYWSRPPSAAATGSAPRFVAGGMHNTPPQPQMSPLNSFHYNAPSLDETSSQHPLVQPYNSAANRQTNRGGSFRMPWSPTDVHATHMAPPELTLGGRPPLTKRPRLPANILSKQGQLQPSALPHSMLGGYNASEQSPHVIAYNQGGPPPPNFHARPRPLSSPSYQRFNTTSPPNLNRYRDSGVRTPPALLDSYGSPPTPAYGLQQHQIMSPAPPTPHMAPSPRFASGRPQPGGPMGAYGKMSAHAMSPDGNAPSMGVVNGCLSSFGPRSEFDSSLLVLQHAHKNHVTANADSLAPPPLHQAGVPPNSGGVYCVTTGGGPPLDGNSLSPPGMLGNLLDRTSQLRSMAVSPHHLVSQSRVPLLPRSGPGGGASGY